MIKKVVCKYCNKEFIKDNYEYYRYLSECAEHEMSHLNLKEEFKNNLISALNSMDKKYNCESNYWSCTVDLYYYSNYNNDDPSAVSYTSCFDSNKFEKKKITINVDYDNLEHVPTENEIIQRIEKYYVSEIKKEYSGIVEFEDWCGGYGADDYVLNGQYIKNIFEQLKGKKIKITVLD